VNEGEGLGGFARRRIINALLVTQFQRRGSSAWWWDLAVYLLAALDERRGDR
jgi:hypothetical protein